MRLMPTKPVRAKRSIPAQLWVGEVGERLVELYALVGSGARLISAKPRPDIDHKDFILDEYGGYRTIYLQVKAASHPQRDRNVQFQVIFKKGEILANRRLLYVFCLVDLERIQIVQVWVVPSPDFNRLATRVRKPSKLILEFAAPTSGARGGGKWGRFRVPPLELGKHLYDYLMTAPPDEPLQLEGLQLLARRAAGNLKRAAA